MSITQERLKEVLKYDPLTGYSFGSSEQTLGLRQAI